MPNPEIPFAYLRYLIDAFPGQGNNCDDLHLLLHSVDLEVPR